MNKFDGIENFTENEFDCKCDCGAGIDVVNRKMLVMLEHARVIAGIPFVLSSAVRCKIHNKRVGGSDTSSHLTGHGVDIEIWSNRARYIIKKALKEAGFKRIGDSKDGNFIHTDNDESKSQYVEWLY